MLYGSLYKSSYRFTESLESWTSPLKQIFLLYTMFRVSALVLPHSDTKTFLFSRGCIKPRTVQQYEVMKVVVAVPSRIQNSWSCLPGSSVIHASCACATSFSFRHRKNLLNCFLNKCGHSIYPWARGIIAENSRNSSIDCRNETTLLCDCDFIAMKCVMNVYNTCNEETFI